MIHPASTRRLILRRPMQSDAEEFFDLFTDADTCRCDGGYPPYTAMDDAFAADFARMWADYDNRLFIVLPGDGRMIGLLHAFPGDEPGTAEIGYVIHRDFRRLGYAREAVSAVIDQLRSQYGAVVCTAYRFNAASIGLLQSLGFAETPCAPNEKHPEFSERRFVLAL